MNKRALTCVAAPLLLSLAGACGGDSSDSKWLDVGGFKMAVPADWNYFTDDPDKGAVRMVTLKIGSRKDKPNVIVIARPLPKPLEIDPTVPENCKKHVDSLTVSVDKHEIVTLPAGKACAVQATSGKMQVSQVVLAAKGEGIMANCMYELADDKKLCDQVFNRIKLR